MYIFLYRQCASGGNFRVGAKHLKHMRAGKGSGDVTTLKNAGIVALADDGIKHYVSHRRSGTSPQTSGGWLEQNHYEYDHFGG